MNIIDEFEKYLSENEKAFRIWGEYVKETIEKQILSSLNIDNINCFLKVPATPRVKEIKSALGKVARKGYDDPIQQMTDLVGVRFVVLLSTEMDSVCEVIEHINSFESSVSKNYLDEIDVNPKIFDYQSKHYEIRPKDNITINDIDINKNICCEVQVRTLLQHAYAELVHDSVYKPIGPVPKGAERQIAKSMALMETTDDLFCNTMRLLKETNLSRNNFLDSLKRVYIELIGDGYLLYDEDTNYCFLDSFRDYYTEDTITEIRGLLSTKKFISKKIKSRASRNGFFCQPTILFAYYLLCNESFTTIRNHWPLPGYLPDFDLITSDLGISSHN